MENSNKKKFFLRIKYLFIGRGYGLQGVAPWVIFYAVLLTTDANGQSQN
jgi:hypothetical protein